MTIPLNRFDALEDTDLLACTDTNGVTYNVTGAQFMDLFVPPPPQLTHVTPPSHHDKCSLRTQYLVGDVVEAFAKNYDPAYSFQWYVYDYFAGPDGVKEVIGEAKTLTLTPERINAGNVWVRLLNADGEVVSTLDAFNGDDVALDILQKVEAKVYYTPHPWENKTMYRVIFEKIDWEVGNDDLIPCDGENSVWIEGSTLNIGVGNNIFKQNYYDNSGGEEYSITNIMGIGRTEISFYMSRSGSLNDPTLVQFQCISIHTNDYISVGSVDDIPPQLTFNKKPVP